MKPRTIPAARWLIPALMVVPWIGHATVVTLEYSHTFELGGAVYPGTAPVLRATLSDDGPGSTRVHFLLEGINLLSGDYVRNWAFNFSGDAENLGLSHITKTGSFNDPAFHAPASTLGGGNPPFSFSLEFSTSNKGGGTRRFEDNESLSFDVTLAKRGVLRTLTVEDFLGSLHFMDQNLVSGVFFAGNSGSFHYKGEEAPVPEPATFAFGGSMAIGLALAELKRRRKP
jgi:hypothetical protein